MVVEWWRALPPEDKDLLAGVLVGREAGIGYNAWYYNGEYPEPPGGGWRIAGQPTPAAHAISSALERAAAVLTA